MKISPYEWILLIACSIAVYRRIRRHKLIPLLAEFLVVAVIFELFITFYWMKWDFADEKYFASNLLPYNLFAILCASYYNYVYFPFLDQRAKLPVKVIIAVWLIFSMVWLSRYGWLKVNYAHYISGMIIAMLLIFNYLYRLVYKESHSTLRDNPYIYFGLGVLLFIFSVFPLLYFINYLVLNPETSNIYANLLKYSNIFLSLGYLGAALCQKEKI